MPKLVRFVVINSAIGIAIGWALSLAVLYYNIAGLGDLYAHSNQKHIILFIMAMSSGVTFGFAFLSTAVMLLPESKDDFDRL